MKNTYPPVGKVIAVAAAAAAVSFLAASLLSPMVLSGKSRNGAEQSMQMDGVEQSSRDAPQKPYRPSPGAESQRTGLRRPALPYSRARGRRDGVRRKQQQKRGTVGMREESE